ncbi:MAG TPA: hypothetical protein VD932_03625 [Aquabacterium sp.]|nr:hypothetical protein [Aquabacterium sp.]
MKVKALRGVCIGVDRHLVAGDTADLDPGLVTYLVNIRAVEAVKDEPPKAEATAQEAAPLETPSPSEPAPAEKAKTANDSTPAKPGKKEK